MNPKKIVEIDKLQELFEDSSVIYMQAVESIGFPDRIKDFGNYINYLFLLRFGHNFKAISSLLKLFEESSYFKIPIFLILRTCLSDLLTFYYFLYVIRKYSNDSDKINEVVYGFLVDHLHRVENELEGMLNKSEISEQDYNSHKEYLKQYFHDFHGKDSKLIKKRFVSFRNIHDLLKDDPELSWVSKAYEYYNYMSKFEHVGALTNELQEFHKLYDWYDKNGILITFSLLNDGIYHIIKSIKNEELNEMLSKLINKIRDNFIKE